MANYSVRIFLDMTNSKYQAGRAGKHRDTLKFPISYYSQSLA